VFFRGGQNWEILRLFPSHDGSCRSRRCDLVCRLFYDARPKLPLVLLAILWSIRAGREALSLGPHVTLAVPRRGDKKRLVDRDPGDGASALFGCRLAESASQRLLLEGVAAAFGLAELPEGRTEVYDNSTSRAATRSAR
jgi:excinuclease ABC subunit C